MARFNVVLVLLLGILSYSCSRSHKPEPHIYQAIDMAFEFLHWRHHDVDESRYHHTTVREFTIDHVSYIVAIPSYKFKGVIYPGSQWVPHVIFWKHNGSYVFAGMSFGGSVNIMKNADGNVILQQFMGNEIYEFPFYDGKFRDGTNVLFNDGA